MAHVVGRAGGDGPGIEAAHDPGLQRFQLAKGAGPHVVLGRGLGGHDVGGLPALGHDAVDLVARAEVLAQEADGDLGDGQGVGGVDAPLGEGRGVRRLPVEEDVEVGDGQALHVDLVHGRGVDHHRRVDAIEGAPLEHEDLAAASFLGRGSQHPHRDPQVVGHPGQRRARPDGGGGDHVVTAGVADPRQGVVLGADPDGQRAPARGGDEGGGEIADPRLHVESGVRQRLCHPTGGPLLLEGQLGMGVDGVGQLDQARRRGLHLAPGCGPQALGHPASATTMATTSPADTVSPGFTRTSLTVPAASELMLFSIFMASRTQMV